MRSELPSGEVTLLFTDIEGSTRLLIEVGATAYARLLAEHRRKIRAAVVDHGGVEVDTQGDAFFIAFPNASDAVRAAVAAQAAMVGGRILVRMGLHTGRPLVTDEGYVGSDVHLGARIGAVAHGGQVIVSKQTFDAAGPLPDCLSLGEHRLKDVPRPVKLYQVGRTTFPRLRSLSTFRLPTPVSSFLGRERELEDIRGHLLRGDRLLTLTGPGGTGKTRLAIAAAGGLRDAFPDGIVWIELASILEAPLVLPTIARALEIDGDLAAGIADRTMLLILDNMEQVVEAAGSIAGLLGSCPHLAILVTSRVLLRADGERHVPVAPLEAADAVALFVTRSGLEPSPEIPELCRALDELPLAIELAAARARVIGVRAVLDRLGSRLDLLSGGRDLDRRRRTMRETIAWSDDLLTSRPRRLLRRMSLFVGGCDLDTAESVLDADLDDIQTLVEHSLVRVTGGRFWMLETIRAFAAEAFAAEVDADHTRARFVSWAIDLLEREDGLVRGPQQLPALERLDLEIDNLRAAFDIADNRPESDRDVDVVRRFAIAARWWLERRGFVEEARGWAERALRGPQGDPGLLGWTLLNAATSEFASASSGEGQRRLDEAERLGSLAGDQVLVATVLEQRGFLDPGPDGWAMLERAGQIFAQLGRRDEQGRVAINLAAHALNQGDDERAVELAGDGIRWATELGNRHALGMAMANRAAAAALLGRDQEAIDAITAGSQALDEIGDRVGYIFLLESAALLSARRGDAALAASMVDAVETAYGRFGLTHEPSDVRLISATRAAIDAGEAVDGAPSESGSAWPEPRDAVLEWVRAPTTSRA